MREIKITPGQSGQRLDKFLLKLLNNSTKGFIYKSLRKKSIKLNSKKANGNELLSEGDILHIYFSETSISSLQSERKVNPFASDLNIIYEDENLLICNKPAGVLSHPEQSTDSDTLIDRILNYLSNKTDLSKNSSFTPALCNRLDRNTSGIILCGKTLHAVTALNEAIKNNQLDKHYLTIVKGTTPEAGEIRGYLIKDSASNTSKIVDTPIPGAKASITQYKRIKTSDGYPYSLLRVHLVTGRSHQIRAAFKHLGYPLLGDRKYGDFSLNNRLAAEYNIKNQLLHAESIQFNCDSGLLSYMNGKTITCPPPEIFETIFNKLAQRGR